MHVVDCDVPSSSALGPDTENGLLSRFFSRSSDASGTWNRRALLRVVRTYAALDEAIADRPEYVGPLVRSGSSNGRRNHEARDQKHIQCWREDRALADLLHRRQ